MYSATPVVPPPLDPPRRQVVESTRIARSEICVERFPMYRIVRKITGFVSTLLLFALASPAQLDTGTITVAVKDPSGSVVLGAHVVLRNENTGIDARTGVSNEQGNFNAPLIPSGSYSVHVELPGFKSYQQSGMSRAE